MRSKMLEARRSLMFEKVLELSAVIQGRFLVSPHFTASKKVLLYASFNNEVLTEGIFEAAVRQGKHVYYPRVAREGRIGLKAGSEARGLKFFRVKSLSELKQGSYDIKEPGHPVHHAYEDGFDVAVVPGVAFDVSGNRVGYGKGYFDAALKGVHCAIVALAYDFQVLSEADRVHSEPHDVRVTEIMTEKRTIDAGRAGKR